MSTIEAVARPAPSASISDVYSGAATLFRLLRQTGWGPELLNLGYYPHFFGLGALINGLRTLSTAQWRLVLRSIDLVQVTPGDRVLDIACGRGGSSYMLRHSTLAESIDAIDLLAENIEMARKLFPADQQLTYTQADAQSLPFADQSFHKALCCEAAFHFPDRGQFLSEMCRVLQPGGRLVVVDFVWRTPEHRRCRNQPMGQVVRKVWEWDDMSSACEYRTMGERAGLKLAEVHDWTAQVTTSLQKLSECTIWLSRRKWGHWVLRRRYPMTASFTAADWEQLELEVAAHRFLHDHTYYKAMIFEKP